METYSNTSSWAKWSLWAALLTLLYLPLTFNEQDLLYRSPISKDKCSADEYCRANLMVFPIRLIAPGGDAWSYLSPIDYLFSQGKYWEDFRMPGYGVVYGLFRLVTGSRELAIWLLFLTQLIFWSIALGLLGGELSKRGIKSIFVFSSLALVCFSPASYYVRVIGSESLTASLAVLSLLSLLHKKYMLSGALATWVFFIRPLHIIWVFVGVLYVLWAERKIRPALAFILPFVGLEGAWVTRNYIHYGDFRPFHGNKGLHYTHDHARYLFYVLELSRHLGYRSARISNRNIVLTRSLFCEYPILPSNDEIRRMLPSSITHGFCAPETLRAVMELACELKRSPTYGLAPPESLIYSTRSLTLKNAALDYHPSPDECKKELIIEHRLRRCLLEVKRYYKENPLAYFENLLLNLFNLTRLTTFYDWLSSEVRLKIKVLYYDAYKWLYLVGLLVAAYYLVKGPDLTRILSLYALSIVGGYLVWGILEARYADTVAPQVLVTLSIGGTELLGKGILSREDKNGYDKGQA